VEESKRLTIDGYILTGGAASRMGGDKALLTISGRTFVQQIAAGLSRVTRDVFVVGGKTPGLTTVPDIPVDGGQTKSSMTGLYSALRHSRSEWVFVVACDMPFVTAELFEAIIELSDGAKCAVIPVSSDGVAQPLCGLYRVSACVEKAESALKNGQRSLQRLLDDVDAQRVGFEHFQGLAGSEHLFMNVNTPKEYALALRLADREPSG